MRKIRIKKDNKIIFESSSYSSYENKDFIEFDFFYLYNADLENADLRYAILSDADLRNADLRNADLNYAILSDEEKIRKGYVNKNKKIVYKKCNDKIVELELLKNSIVFSINNFKCRTNRVKVVSIDGDKTKGLKIASNYDKNFIYEVGKIVEVEDFNLMYNIECASGIHFFMNKKDAENYNE